MRKLLATSLTLAAFAAATLAPVAASAQDRAQCEEEQQNESGSGGKKNYKTVIGPDGRKVFVIERAFIVCGKVPKPQVIYVFHQRAINYEWETMTKDFLGRVLSSVEKAPF
jgi:hypothetical protein